MVALSGTAWAKMMRIHFRGLSPRFQRLGTITGHTVVQVRAAHALAHVHIAGLDGDFHLEAPGLPGNAAETGIAEQLDVGMGGHLHQFRPQDADGAVQGGEGLVQLRHGAADAQGGLGQVNLEAGVGQVQGRLAAPHAAAHHQHLPADRDRRDFRLLPSLKGQGQGTQRGLQISAGPHIHHRKPRLRRQGLEKAGMDLRPAGGHQPGPGLGGREFPEPRQAVRRAQGRGQVGLHPRLFEPGRQLPAIHRQVGAGAYEHFSPGHFSFNPL